MPGRFFLGVGSGENHNEHLLGARWPAPDERLDMLEEAVARARLYTLPDEPPPLSVAASAPNAAELAGRVGNGLIGTAPKGELVERFTGAGGGGPRIAMLTVCWAESEEEARRTALEWWPNAGLKGELSQELATPEHFEQAAANVREEDVAELIVCGPDAEAAPRGDPRLRGRRVRPRLRPPGGP
jgi:coenzyme F420-dependent glucose-6-phosphate dehydrogenase